MADPVISAKFPAPFGVADHPVIQDIHRELGHLHRHFPTLTSAQIGRMLRVEISYETLNSIRALRDLQVMGLTTMSGPNGKEGAPITCFGVDCYPVDRLPVDCAGYRVINPLRAL